MFDLNALFAEAVNASIKKAVDDAMADRDAEISMLINRVKLLEMANLVDRVKFLETAYSEVINNMVAVSNVNEFIESYPNYFEAIIHDHIDLNRILNSDKFSDAVKDVIVSAMR